MSQDGKGGPDGKGKPDGKSNPDLKSGSDGRSGKSWGRGSGKGSSSSLRRLRSSSGNMRQSSIFRAAEWLGRGASVWSLPITRAATCIRLSHITGFTLPGMIELPG